MFFHSYLNRKCKFEVIACNRSPSNVRSWIYPGSDTRFLSAICSRHVAVHVHDVKEAGTGSHVARLSLACPLYCIDDAEIVD